MFKVITLMSRVITLMFRVITLMFRVITLMFICVYGAVCETYVYIVLIICWVKNQKKKNQVFGRCGSFEGSK